MANNIANILMRISGDDDDGDRTLSSFAAKLKAFGKTEATATADIEIGRGEGKLAEAAAALAAFGKIHATATADVNVNQGNLDSTLAALNNFGVRSRDEKLNVDLDDGKALAKLAALSSAINRLDGKKINLDVDTNKLSLGTALMGKFASVLGQASDVAGKAGNSIGGVTVNMGAFGLKLSPVVGLVIALVAVIAVSLVGALALLVTALAAATAAVGALATAFVAALGPAVALAVGVVTKIVNILKILKAQKDANAAADRKTVEGAAAASAADERRRNALVAVASALRAVRATERGRDQAITAARDAIVQANRDEVSAAQDLTRASENTAMQLVAAYRAIKDSAEAARDALLDVESAQLGIQESTLAVKEAQLALAEFRKESGLAGNAFDELFKKATNVDANVDVSPALAKLVPASGSNQKDAALKLERLILNVQRAKIGEKQATDQLQDSEQALNDKRKEATKFAKEGISAFEPYTSAVRAQEDATTRLADATERSNQLEADGIANSNAVLAATDALTNANIRLKEARHNATIAAKGAGGSDAAIKAKADWDALTSSERAFGLALSKTIDFLKGFFGPAVGAILGGFTRALKTVPGTLNPLKAAFTNFGRIVGRVFAGFAVTLGQPEIQAGFIRLIGVAGQLAKTLGGKAFTSFFLLMLNLATATIPFLIRLVNRFVAALSGLATASGPGKLTGTLGKIFRSLDGVLGLIKAVGRVFLNFFSATIGPSQGFVKTLTDMANRFADFLGSKDGQEQVQKFFKDIMPLAVESLKLMGNVLVLIIRLTQILAPALTGLVATLNFLLSVINVVLGVLRPFLQIAIQIGLLFAVGLPKAVVAFLSKFSLLKGLSTFLTQSIGGTVIAIIGRLAFLADVIPRIFSRITNFFLGLIRGIGDIFLTVTEILVSPFRLALDLIDGLGSKFIDAGKAIVSNIVKGVLSVPGAIAKGVVGLFNKAVELLPGSEPKDKSSPLAGLRKRGAAIIDNLAAGIPQRANALSGALHSALVPVVAGIDANIAIPRASGSSSSSVGQQFNGPYIASQQVNMADLGAAGSDAQTQAELMAYELRRRGRG